MTFTPEIRRKCMQANKSVDTRPELVLRKALCEAGYGGYRLHWKVAGKPDICYPGRKVAIFVNGCFWHRCPHCNPPMPVTNVEFWEEKFRSNVERDYRNRNDLEQLGWVVIVIWECEIKNNLDKTVQAISSVLRDHQRI